MNCSAPVEIIVVATNSTIYLLLLLLHSYATCIVFAARRSFHPFFIMFFIPFIIGYVLCDLFFLMWDTARRLGVADDSMLQILTLHVWTIAYRTVTPIVISFLLERLYATVNNGYYERARPLKFILLLPIGLALAILDDQGLSNEWFPAVIEQYGLLGLEFFIALLLSVLLLINRRLVFTTTGKGVELTARYQLAENVRVLGLVIKVVILDGSITVVNTLGILFFEVHADFNLQQCNDNELYLPMYILINSISLGISTSVAFAIIYGHQAMTKAAYRLCGILDRPMMRKRGRNKITNVLGIDIQMTQTAQEYFNSLQW